MKRSLFLLLLCMLCMPISAFAQQYALKGVVKDETGEGLPGVSILVKGTSRGAATDIDGSYTINVAKGETVVFSYVGCLPQSIKITGQKTLDVTMKATDDSLDEVIVVGYGSQSKRTVSSSIASVDGKTLENSPNNTIGDGLKGKIAGVRVFSSDNTPGAEATFIIRGGSSISQSYAPLFLVEGVERTMEGLNPNDIESIQVLKDAASSAIYGSRASNGVVLITTKKGSKGKMRITFEAGLAYENTERMIEYLSAEEAVPLMRDRWASGPNAATKLHSDGYAYSDANTNASKYSTRYLQPGESIPAGWKSCQDPLDPTKTLIFEDNDWAGDCFRAALWQNYYLGVDGGTDNLSYNASIGYTRDSGVAVGSGFNRFSARTNVVAKILKNLKFTSNLDFSQTNTEAYASQYQVISRGMMTPAVQRKTFVSDDQWYGTPTTGPNASSPNPAFYDYYNDNKNRVNRTGLVGTLDYEPLRGWHIVGSASFFNSQGYRDSFHRADPYNGTRNATAANTDFQRLKLEAYTNYTFSIGQSHNFNAMVGYSWQKYDYRSFSGSANNHATDKIPTLNAGVPQSATSTYQKEVNIGYFGRINYDFKKKYLLTLTFREDGSSRFADGNQWGFFPGASVGWIMSSENFMQGIDWINNLKLRVSYGQTGNNNVGYYDALGLYATTTNYDGEASVVASAMPNKDLRWEKSTQLDAGFDFSVLNDRISLGFDFFNKITNDLITSRQLPNTSAFGSILTNNGKVRVRGFDIELNTRNIVKKDFEWDSRFTLTYVKNKVLELPEAVNPDDRRAKNRQGGYTVTMADGSTIEFGGTAEGEPLGRIYGYKHAYIITTKEQAANANYDASSKGWDWTTGTRMGNGKKTIGDYEWCDLNGDGKINGSDMYLLGNTIPHTTGGFGNTFTYKGFTLNIYLDFAFGHSISNGYLQRQMCNFMGGNTSLPRELLKAWNEGDDPAKAKYARFSGNDSDDLNKNYRDNSDIFVQKADYLCIREVSLSYQMPTKLVKKAGMQDVRFTFAGNNLHYFTDVIGLSPEMGSASTYNASFNTYPPIRKFSFNVKVTF